MTPTTNADTAAGSGRRRLVAPPSAQPLPRPAAPPLPAQDRFAGAAGPGAPTPPVGTPGATGRPSVSPPPAAEPADPPIYVALLRHWEGSGRTVPGRHDQEWNRIVAAPVWARLPQRISATRGRRGGGR